MNNFSILIGLFQTNALRKPKIKTFSLQKKDLILTTSSFIEEKVNKRNISIKKSENIPDCEFRGSEGVQDKIVENVHGYPHLDAGNQILFHECRPDEGMESYY